QLPAPAKINLIAVESRQPEVKDVIQPAVAKSTVDRLELRANEVADARGSGSDEHVSLAKPSADVKLGKLAGSTPRITENRVTAAKSAGQPRMAADSLAAESPDRIERKKNEVGGLSPEATAAATLLEPVRMGYVQPLIAATRPGTPGQVPSSAPTGQRELTTAREKIAVSGVRQLTDGKPRAGVKDAVPSKEPIRIGLGGEAFAEPMSKAPAVHDVISDVSAERPGLPSLGDPALKMELMQDDQRARGPAADKLGPSDLAAVKINGGLGSAHVAAVRVAPKRVARSQNVGVTSGTLIEESGVPLQTRESTSAAVKEQLAGAQAGGGNPIGHGLADMGAPVQAVAGVMRGGSSGEGSDIRSVALAPARAKHASAPSEAGGIERPSPTRLGEALGRSRAGRSDLPVSQDSFVGQGPSVAAPRVASSAVSEGEQVETAASLTLRGGDAKVLAGRMSVESQQGEDSRLTDGGEGEGGRGQAELSLGKAGGEAAASGISVKRFQTPGRAGGGLSAAPAGTLVVQSDLQAVGRATASGTAEKESLVALNTSASASDSSGPALVAPTVIRRDSSAGGTAEAGGLPVGVGDLQVAKAGGADPFLFEPQGGGGLGELAETMNGVSEPDPSLMDLILSAGPSKARVTSDISASPSGQVARRSFLSVGTTPNPEFVPEKAIYKMRKPEKRRQFIKELGGTVQTEEAVEQALAWLSRAQSDDGRWDIDGFKTLKECGGAGDLVNEDVGVTGLVLLAYLGAGYTHLDGAYQETVRKGLDWLLNCEKKDGDIRGAGQMYGQAMATTALCESYALTGDERLLAPTQRAVKFIVDSQTPESGWRYMSRNDSDTSVTGWQILALKSAQIAGFTVPDQTFRWMNLWLDKVRQGADGGLYSYKPGHVVTPVMTAEGAFCQLFMGEQANARAQAESVAFIMQNLPVWNPESRSVHIYYWYYATLTIYLSGAQEFKAWNSALTKALLQGRSTSGPAAGSWDPVCLLGFRGGRIYSTAVGALCLEVYYRFLPLYKQKKP
ncbi:MAG: terpene cyclase/mutase family protein, partial [Verrucomicrobia bacterium]|nr:terpene cyclase/mutase family protein [Verrucomicrobiota bacterium]MBU4248434.1 terpene cyclase/mutase family protein [Verrucomicrobiota bacterium]MBU4290172.1 terpene cyclase/mutase family protein [Verrucomicrobiota bacterium]MBU4498247.1 terpene cyclase/mutase family protein [Verrucomicrobiota bacterium]MCG2679427.1 terpene cyclase/mutase family protein [Kiritimatiellia bacterium]